MREAEEFRDVVRRRDAGLEHEGALPPVTLVVVGAAEWRAMRHVSDGVGLHDSVAVGIPPDPPRMAVDHGLRHRRLRQTMHVEPLLDDLAGIVGMDGAIGAAMPHRHARKMPAMPGGAAHELAKFGRGSWTK